jgi:hypothetical protein
MTGEEQTLEMACILGVADPCHYSQTQSNPVYELIPSSKANLTAKTSKTKINFPLIPTI